MVIETAVGGGKGFVELQPVIINITIKRTQVDLIGCLMEFLLSRNPALVLQPDSRLRGLHPATQGSLHNHRLK